MPYDACMSTENGSKEFDRVLAKMRELEDALGMPRNSTLDQMIRKAGEMKTDIRDHERDKESHEEELTKRMNKFKVRANNRVRKIVRALRGVRGAMDELQKDKAVVDARKIGKLLGE